MPSIVEMISPQGAPSAASPVLNVITAARRTFATAQMMLAGAPLAPPKTLSVGWHGSSVNAESGSFAVVRAGGGLDDLIGEVVQVNASGRIVYAYVLTSAAVPVQLSLTRRLFLALHRLTLESIAGKVAPVQ